MTQQAEPSICVEKITQHFLERMNQCNCIVHIAYVAFTCYLHVCLFLFFNEKFVIKNSVPSSSRKVWLWAFAVSRSLQSPIYGTNNQPDSFWVDPSEKP